MKKLILITSVALLLNTSCATIFLSGKEHCKIKPQTGQAKRQIHTGAFIFDLLIFFPGAIIDHINGNLYKPCK